MTVLGEEKSEEMAITQATDNNEPKDTDKGVFDDIEKPTEIDAKDLPRQKDVHVNMPDRSGYSVEELMITAKEKADFMDAVISGGRYCQAYDIFGGKVHVVIRNRTANETQAMYAYMRHELSRKDRNVSMLEGDMSYAMLVAQVDEINGTKYPYMKEPYMFTAAGDAETKPGWLDDLNAWKNKHEALTSAIIHQIQLFEYKYWRMVSEASNKNFWNSDTSIEG